MGAHKIGLGVAALKGEVPYGGCNSKGAAVAPGVPAITVSGTKTNSCADETTNVFNHHTNMLNEGKIEPKCGNGIRTIRLTLVRMHGGWGCRVVVRGYGQELQWELFVSI